VIDPIEQSPVPFRVPGSKSPSRRALRIAILHYHLRRGGVTRVIELASEALVAAGHEVLVFAGEVPPPGGQPVEVLSGLRYGCGIGEAADLVSGVSAACRRRWGADADVLHVHNHSLGKNLALPTACTVWALSGRAMVLQMHDFAENGRPANYRYLKNASGGAANLDLYPQGGRIALAVLTSHAAAAFAAAGGSAEVLPNPVVLPAGGDPINPGDLGAESLVVYPTRGIRRKNLGEFLLHAAAAPKGVLYAVTAAPAGGKDLELYAEWRRFSEALGLPVLFDAAQVTGRPLGDFFPGAATCMTTSMEEGFGMAFLEPWAAGCPLTGRDLPAVTEDFRDEGLQLDSLYARWEIPAGLLDRRAVNRTTDLAVDAALEAYGLPPSAKARTLAREAVWGPGGADFGRLDELAQKEVIASARGLPPPELPMPSRDVITANRALLAGKFSSAAYGDRLEAIYQRIIEATGEVPVYLDSRRVLDAILDFSDFSALRF